MLAAGLVFKTAKEIKRFKSMSDMASITPRLPTIQNNRR